MKRIFALVFSFSLMLSLVVLSAEPAAALGISVKKQVGYLKRKTKKIYHRSKNGTKYVAHKTKRGTEWTAHKTKHGTKKAYVKTKTEVKD